MNDPASSNSTLKGKTLLLLGGTQYLVPVIKTAQSLGCRVVTCDFLPDNIAHQYSDDYRNASIIDEEAVLDVARDVRADGILSYAVDPGVQSAAYAAEKLGLSFQGSYEAVRVLQNKDLFRAFLRDNGFNAPASVGLTTARGAVDHCSDIPYPVMVKPVDSAGSKGVSRVDRPEHLESAVTRALGFSPSGRCIIEQYIDKRGDAHVVEAFTINGRFVSVAITDQIFDASGLNPFAPVGHKLPSALEDSVRVDILNQLNRLAEVLQLRDGMYNIEVRQAPDGTVYLMEVAPRGGGNRLGEYVRTASDVDLIEASVLSALGAPPSTLEMPRYNGHWYLQVLHSLQAGVFESVEFTPGFAEAHLVDMSLNVAPGDRVERFTAANFSIGSAFLRFDTREELDAYVEDPAQHCRVRVTKST